jgi:antitoxin component YwqK of YwqJK toxin-antitoxin module
MNINNLIKRIKSINPDLELRFVGEFDKNNLRTGYWEWYYPNGKLWYKGNFINGIQDGYWEFYYINGDLYKKGHYINGLEDGYWEEYHINGNLYSKGNYVNGKFYEIK